MDGHEQLTDEALDREIAAALDVQPSPEFVARIRTQVANERADVGRYWLFSPSPAGFLRLLAIGSLAAVVAVLGAGVFRAPVSVEPEAQRVGIAAPVTAPDDVPEIAVSRPEPVRPAATNAIRTVKAPELVLPAVVIAEGEKRGLEQLMVELRQAEQVAVVDSGGVSDDVAGPPWLHIAPVVIEPFPPFANLQGEE